jgi:hypothetical protein
MKKVLKILNLNNKKSSINNYIVYKNIKNSFMITEMFIILNKKGIIGTYSKIALNIKYMQLLESVSSRLLSFVFLNCQKIFL